MQKKHLTKFNTLFVIKTPNKLETEGNYLNIIKAMYEKPTANITLNEETESSPSKVRHTAATAHFLTTSPQHSLSQCTRQEKEKKATKLERKM